MALFSSVSDQNRLAPVTCKCVHKRPFNYGLDRDRIGETDSSPVSELKAYAVSFLDQITISLPCIGRTSIFLEEGYKKCCSANFFFNLFTSANIFPKCKLYFYTFRVCKQYIFYLGPANQSQTKTNPEWTYKRFPALFALIACFASLCHMYIAVNRLSCQGFCAISECRETRRASS